VYVVDADGVPLQGDGAHYTGDGLVGVDGLGDRIAQAMIADGLTVTPFAAEARVWTVEATAQTFADTAQTDHSDRDEDPAEGGFGRRLGAGCQDPWPTTPRDALEKHPYRDEWCVPMDGVIDADATYDRATMRRPVDLTWWSHG
jgi:hypothetical protein